MNNTILNITPENKIKEWQKCLIEYLDNNKEIYFVFDLETTGLSAYGEAKTNFFKDRITEIGIIPMIKDIKTGESFMAEDKEGNKIYFHEYVNFLRETQQQLARNQSQLYVSKESEYITGITKEVLYGKENLPGLDRPLPKAAPTFQELFPFLSDFLLFEKATDYYPRIYGVAHNASFDFSFLNAEMENIGYSPAESYLKKVDTVNLSKQCIKPENFELFNQNNEELIENIKIKVTDGIKENNPKAIKKLKADYYRLLEAVEKNVNDMEFKGRGIVKTKGNSKQAVQTNLRNDLQSLKKTIDSDNINEISEKDIKKIYDGIKTISKVGNYTLDDLQKYFKIKTEREFHGALLDTQILVDVFSNIIKLDSYKNAPNMPPQYKESIKNFIDQKMKKQFDPQRKKLPLLKI